MSIIFIKDIFIKENKFYIESDIGMFYSTINNGSVNFKIFDNNNNELYLCSINIGEKVRLYYKNNIIKKIIIDTKYSIDLDSSDSLDIEDIIIIN